MLSGIRRLHVDIDPRSGEDLKTERYRILKCLEKFFPRPTLVIFSGGGFQAFWKLDKPIPVDDISKIPELEAYNKQFEILLGGDSCHNIDRIMRLPGTVNIPNEKKRKKGRRETLATVQWFEDTCYPIPTIENALTPRKSKGSGIVKLKTLSKTNIDDLNVSPMIKQVILHGKCEELNIKDKSRSGYMITAVCALVKANHTDEQIVSILLNPELKISECILDQSNPEKYAIRQIERAKTFSEKVFNKTDLGNAKRLIFHHGLNIRYVPPLKNWLIWKENRWAFDEDGEIHRLAKSTIKAIHIEAAKYEEDEIRKAWIGHALRSENVNRIKAMIELTKTESTIPILPSDLDNNDWLIGTYNGVVNLKTLQSENPDREDYITKSIPLTFDPDAKCPFFLRFLEKIMDGNTNLIQFIQRAVGYSLTGLTKEQVLFLLYGTGANGKSVFLATISTLLGDYSSQASAETFMIKNNPQISNDLARLRGSRFVATSEIEDGQRMAESLVKQMTGQDPIVSRFLYKESFEYVPKFKIWIAANHKPIIRGDDNAIWRRIILIPFSVTIPKKEQDPDLSYKLKNELPGILNWTLEGCKNWQEQGLNPPTEVMAATEEYRDDMDIIGPWLDECCVIQENARCRSKDLYENYRIWSEENFKFALSQAKWGRKIIERGFKREKKPRTWYRGIGLRSNIPF